MELERFRNMVLLDIQHTEEKLKNSWYTKVIALFSGEDKVIAHIPSAQNESFYGCVTTLIGNHIRSEIIQ